MNTAAATKTDTLGQKRTTLDQLIREATEERRRPLRGSELVAIARKAGLDWAATGTGWKPHTAITTTDGGHYLVLDNGSFVRCRVVGAQAFPLGQTLTKKQRNRLKRAARFAAEMKTKTASA